MLWFTLSLIQFYCSLTVKKTTHITMHNNKLQHLWVHVQSTANYNLWVHVQSTANYKLLQSWLIIFL